MSVYDYECWADGRVFHMAEKDIPKEIRKLIPRSGLPCNLTGIVTGWCGSCQFGQEKYTPEWFDSAYEDEDELQFGDYS